MMWATFGFLAGVAVGFALGCWTVVALYEESRKIHGQEPIELD